MASGESLDSCRDSATLPSQECAGTLDNGSGSGSDHEHRASREEETSQQQTICLDKEDIVLAKYRAEQKAAEDLIVKMSKDHDRDYKAQILIDAKWMEKELLHLGQGWLVDNISSEITRRLKKRGANIWPFVHKFLPSKYKNFDNRFESTEKSYSHLRTDGRKRIEESSSELFDPYFTPTSAITTNPKSYNFSVSETLGDIIKVSGYTPDEQASGALAASKKLVSIYKKQIERAHLAEEPDDQSSSMDQTRDSKESERETVSTDRPKPHGSLMRDAVKEIIKAFTNLEKRISEFPPEILQRDEEIADGLKTLLRLLDSALDLKYGKSWLDWFKTERYRDIYGKHAAAVMSFSMTNLCAECSDEKTKDWVRMEPQYAFQYASYQCLRCKYQLDTVCPACNLSMKELEKPVVSWECANCGGTKPIHRDLTREQVGDKSSIVMDVAIQVLEHIPWLIAFFMWYSEWIEPYVGGRRKRLSDDLSDRA